MSDGTSGGSEDDIRPGGGAPLEDDARPGGDGRLAAGMKVRRSVLGNAHVDRAEVAKTAFDEDFQRLITEGAWGLRLVQARPDQAGTQPGDHHAAGGAWP